MEIPKVKFIYAYPFDKNRRKYFEDQGLVGDYPPEEKVREKVAHWQSVWDRENEGDRFIKKIMELTTKTPTRSLECFIVGGGINPMSAPFIMPILNKNGVEYSDSKFVEITIHEVSHIFVSGSENYFKKIRQDHSEESVLTQNHIIIYALLESIYLEFFNQLPGDYDRNDLPDSYTKAIEIVKSVGHEQVIKEFQNIN